MFLLVLIEGNLSKMLSLSPILNVLSFKNLVKLVNCLDLVVQCFVKLSWNDTFDIKIYSALEPRMNTMMNFKEADGSHDIFVSGWKQKQFLFQSRLLRKIRIPTMNT